MNEKENKEIYKELSELVSITIKAIKDNHHSDESKTMALQMLQKAQVPVLGGGGRKQIPLGHVFKKEFEETGLTLTEAYDSLHLPKNAEEKNIFDEDGMLPDDDKVNNPSHYQSMMGNINIDCITAMRAAFGDADVKSFCLLNSFKYLFRASSKGQNTDIHKAQWYLNKFLELGGYD